MVRRVYLVWAGKGRDVTRGLSYDGTMRVAVLSAFALTAVASFASGQPNEQAKDSEQAKNSEQAKDSEPLGPLAVALPLEGLIFTPNAQYKLRYRHFEGRDLTENASLDFLRHRARIGAELAYDGRVAVFVQLQDVRFFGDSTVGSFFPGSTGLHQGYAQLSPFDGLAIRAGRQEIAYENQRIIGNLDWLEEARAFDAIRFSFERGPVRVDSFYAKTFENLVLGPGAPIDDGDVVAGNLHVAPLRELEVGFIGVIDRGGIAFPDRTLATFGGLLSGATAVGLSYSVEGYGQIGSGRGELEQRAYMAGLGIQYRGDTVWKPFIAAFGEYLSGNEERSTTTLRTFEYPYPTGHAFHGEMDFFLDIPVDTDQRGLVDVGGTFGLSPFADFVIAPTYHWFASAVDRGDGRLTFGHEIDFKAAYRPWRFLSVDLVYGLFVPGEVWEHSRGTDLEHFAYSTLDVRF